MSAGRSPSAVPAYYALCCPGLEDVVSGAIRAYQAPIDEHWGL